MKRFYLLSGLLVLLALAALGASINTSARCQTGASCVIGGGVASSFVIDTDGASGDGEFTAPDITFEANGDWISNAEADSTFTFEIDEDSTAIIKSGDSTDANTPLTVQSAGTGTLTLQPAGAGAMALGSATTTTYTVTNNGALTLGAAATTDSVTINSAGAITLEATGAINIGDASATSVPIITDGGTVTVDGHVIAQTNVVSLASGALTLNTTHLATAGAADYDIPDSACDAAADIGNWVTVVLEDASVVVSITSDDASNVFYVPGLGLDAGDELDSVSTAAHEGQHITLTCMAAEGWYMTGGNLLTSAGAIAWADGGAAD